MGSLTRDDLGYKWSQSVHLICKGVRLRSTKLFVGVVSSAMGKASGFKKRINKDTIKGAEAFGQTPSSSIPRGMVRKHQKMTMAGLRKIKAPKAGGFGSTINLY